MIAVSRSAVLVTLLMLLSGCSQKSFSIQDLGNSVLQFVGLMPAKAVFDASKAIGRATEEIGREEEYYLGRAVAAQILTRYPAVEDRELLQYLNQVGAAVAAFSDQPITFGGYHFGLVRSAEVNAMAAPGGFIFLTTGMLQLIPDEETLAAVLAHEVSHVVHRHGVKAISQARRAEIASTLAQLAGSLNCTEVGQHATKLFAATVQDLVERLVRGGYDKEQEFEADSSAAQLLQRIGYNPQGLLVLLDQLEVHERALGAAHGGWFDTHPKISARRERLSSIVQATPAMNMSPATVTRTKRYYEATSGRLG